MKQATHTPGPWRYWACKVDSSLHPPMYDYAQFANSSEHVFRASLAHLSEPDARLIAAAPDLLVALKDSLQAMERHIEDGYVAIRVGIARAAISKASLDG